MKRILQIILLAILAPIATFAQTPHLYTAYTATAGVSDLLDQGYPMLVDNNINTKWCVGNLPGPNNLGLYIEFHSAEPIIPTSYVLTTADDNATWTGRNPKNWTLKAKANPNEEWTTLATVTNDQVLQDVNFTDFEFTVDNPNNASYQYFRFDVSSIQSGGCFQLAELRFNVVDCPMPTNLAVDYESGSTALVTWDTYASSCDLWVDGNIISGVASPYTISNFEAGTYINVKVRANCYGYGYSEWSIPVTFKSEDILTVNEQTNTTLDRVPMATGWYHTGTYQSQFIIPNVSLLDMVDGTVKGITFYTTADNIPYQMPIDMQVSLTEVDFTNFGSLVEPTTMVYDGKPSFVSDGNGGGIVTITFNTPFEYHGGNLLVECKNKTQYYGGGTLPTISFKGVQTTFHTSYIAGSWEVNEGQFFLPKVSFTYLPSDCPKPINPQVVVSNRVPTVSWTGNAPYYEVLLDNDVNFYDVTSPFCINYALPPSTHHIIQVRARYGTSPNYIYSEWAEVAFDIDANYYVYKEVAGNTSIDTEGVPAYITKFDEYTRSQFIIAESQLRPVLSQTILGIQFVQVNNLHYNTGVPVDVFIKRVDYNSIGQFETKSGDDIVYHGQLSQNGSGYLTITFDTPYKYTGGSLLVGIENTATGMAQDIRFRTIRYDYGEYGYVAGHSQIGLDYVDVEKSEDRVPLTNLLLSPTQTPEAPSEFTLQYNGGLDARLSWNVTAPEYKVSVAYFNEDWSSSQTNRYSSNDPFLDLYLDWGFNGYPNVEVKVQGHYYADGNSEWSEPFRFRVTNCITPTNLLVSNIAGNEADLDWTENGSATQWEISINGDETNLLTANTHPFTLTGLTALATNTAKVRSVAGTEHSPWSDEVSFTTGCGVLTLDATHSWQEGFESYNVGYYSEYGSETTDIECWGRVQVNSSTHSPFVYHNYYPAACTGMASLELKTTNGQPVMVALPEFSAPIENLHLEFNYNRTDPADASLYTAELGYVADVANANSFYKLFDIPMPEPRGTNSHYSQDLYESYLAHYAPAGSRLAIRFSTTHTGIPSWNFDDFEVSYVEPCPMPSNLVAGSVGLNGATIYWDGSIIYAGSFTVRYRALGTSEYQYVYNVESNDASLSGLSEGTTYEVAVKSDCSDDDWSETFSFTTYTCPTPTYVRATATTATTADLTWNGFWDVEYYEVKYEDVATAGITYLTESFGTVYSNLDNWTLINCYGDSHTYFTYTGYSFKFTHNPDNFTTPQSLVSLELNDVIGGCFLKFQYQNVVNDCPEQFRVGWSSTTNDLSAFTFTEPYSNEATSWPELSVNIPEGTKYICIQYMDGSSAHGLYIDNVSVALAASPNMYNDLKYTISNTNSITLTGLVPCKVYEVQVRSSCNESWSQVASFTTTDEGTKKFVTAGNWGAASNWSPEGVPTATDNVVIRADATIESGLTAMADNVVLQGTASLTINDGGRLQHNNNYVKATVKKHVVGYGAENSNTNKGYILLHTPFMNGMWLNQFDDIYGVRASTYDLYGWNGSAELEWINYGSNYSESVMFIAPKAYLYANQDDTDLTFHSSNCCLFPSNTNWGIRVVYTAPTESTPFSNWNLFGNPFVCDAYLLDDDFGTVSALPYYKMNALGNGFVAVTGDPIAPMEGIFYEAPMGDDNTIYFSRTAPAMRASVLNINLSEANEVLDNAILRFDEGQTMGKFSLHEGGSKVYIPVEGKDLAVAQAEGQVGEIPVNFKAEANGSYTLSFTSEEVTFSYLHLIDNMTGEDVDLLQTQNVIAGEDPQSPAHSYTFQAKTTDYASRFRLLFATGSSTGSDTDTFGFINGAGNLSIFGIEGEATLQVMDVNGRVLSTETFSGSYEKSLNVAAGVYMLRLINGDNVKVQKVVVR